MAQKDAAGASRATIRRADMEQIIRQSRVNETEIYRHTSTTNKLRKRLIKHGFSEDNAISDSVLASLRSLTCGVHCVYNSDAWVVAHRRMHRMCSSPTVEQARPAGKFEISMYFADRARRLVDGEQEMQHKGRRMTGLPHDDLLRHSPRLVRDVMPETPRRGFHEDFVSLITGLSVFPVDRIAKIAAYDFLIDPVVMMAAYLETAAAAIELANSGQVNLAASQGVLELAESLMLAPAACLDYFDSIYCKSDLDGEHAGFTLSGHMLRNESFIHRKHEEYNMLPLVFAQPLTVIQVAVKHDLKLFLSQPVIHSYMRQEWSGGGASELLVDVQLLYKVILVWVFLWPFILLYNICLMLLVATIPPIAPWYVKRTQLHSKQTYERMLCGLAFVPLFKYMLSTLVDLAVALCFTYVEMMPFRVKGRPVFGINNYFAESDDQYNNMLMAFLLYVSIGALLEELSALSSALFDGIELGKAWQAVVRSIAVQLRLTAGHVQLRKSTHSVGRGSSVNYEQRLSRSRQASSNVLLQLKTALLATAQGFHYKKVIAYLDYSIFDILTRLLCLVTLVSAHTYSSEDYDAAFLSMFDKEALRSYTVCCTWLRLMRVLRIFSFTGAFVYMLGQMFKDLVRWMLIYGFGVLAFSASLMILFTNDRSALGRGFYDVGSECLDLNSALRSLSGAILFLVEVTLQGSNYWQCFRDTSAEAPSILIFGTYLVIIILVLLNTLIAMMADTFSYVTHTSFKNYAYSFAKVLVRERCRITWPVPLNLLALPFYTVMGLWSITSTCMGKAEKKIVKPTFRRLGTSKWFAGAKSDSMYESTPVVRGIHSLFKRQASSLMKEMSMPKVPYKATMHSIKETISNDKGVGYDAELLHKVDSIRMMIAQDIGRLHQFERSIARFCKVQEESEEPLTLDDVRDAVRDCIEEAFSKRLDEGELSAKARESFRALGGALGRLGDSGSSLESSGQAVCSLRKRHQQNSSEALECDGDDQVSPDNLRLASTERGEAPDAREEPDAWEEPDAREEPDAPDAREAPVAGKARARVRFDTRPMDAVRDAVACAQSSESAALARVEQSDNATRSRKHVRTAKEGGDDLYWPSLNAF